MSRPAGSFGTHKVCETTKSRNRTGGRRWSKIRARHPPAHAATHCTFSLGARRPQCHDDQVQTLRTVADARNNDPVRFQASSENKSVSATSAQGQWRCTTRLQSYPPSRPRNGTTSFTVTANFTRGLRVLPRQTVKCRHFVPTAW